MQHSIVRIGNRGWKLWLVIDDSRYHQISRSAGKMTTIVCRLYSSTTPNSIFLQLLQLFLLFLLKLLFLFLDIFPLSLIPHLRISIVPLLDRKSSLAFLHHNVLPNELTNLCRTEHFRGVGDSAPLTAIPCDSPLVPEYPMPC